MSQFVTGDCFSRHGSNLRDIIILQGTWHNVDLHLGPHIFYVKIQVKLKDSHELLFLKTYFRVYLDNKILLQVHNLRYQWTKYLIIKRFTLKLAIFLYPLWYWYHNIWYLIIKRFTLKLAIFLYPLWYWYHNIWCTI